MPKKPAKPPARKTAAAPERRRAAAPASRAAPAPRQPSDAAVKRRLRQIENKRGAILQAALEFFSRYGLHGTSIDEIAARADVSKSNLLYYFSSKEELYIALLHELLLMWMEPLLALSAEQDPGEAIRNYIRLKMVNSRDHPEASRLFALEVIQGAPLLRDDIARMVRLAVEEKSDVIRAWIASGKLNPVDPHHLIFSLWAVTQHYADFGVQVQSITGSTLDDPAFFEQAIENVQAIVLRGILPAPARK